MNRSYAILALSLCFSALLSPTPCAGEPVPCLSYPFENAGFEDIPNTAWTEPISGTFKILYTNANARTGTRVAWFGGGLSATDTWSLTQSVILDEAYSTEITFYLKKASGTVGENIQFRVDGQTLYTADSTVNTGGVYVAVKVDLTSFADGLSHLVEFFATTFTAIFVDDICVEQSPKCETFLNFDEVLAPALANQAFPLRDQYADQGIRFRGVGVNDGASILSSATAPNLNGESLSNLLFIADATNSLGGSMNGPTSVYFDSPVSACKFRLSAIEPASGAGALIQSYNNKGELLESRSYVNLTEKFISVNLTLGPIAQIDFTKTAGDYIGLDNFCISGDPRGPDYCSSNSLYSQPPIGGVEGLAYYYFSNEAYGLTAYERFLGLVEPIKALTWWGSFYNGSQECAAPTNEFEIVFYQSVGGEPGFVVATEIVSPTIEETGRIDSPVGLEEKQYRAYLQAPVELENGWISIRSLGTNPCGFTWHTGETGDGTFLYDNGFDGLQSVSFDLALCLSPGNGPLQECADGATFGQPATVDGAYNALFSSDSSNTTQFEKYTITGSVSKLRWWGVQINPFTGDDCIRSENDFAYSFYEDDGGEPGAFVQGGFWGATPQPTGVTYRFGVTDYPLYMYEATLNAPVALSSGWLAIAGADLNTCAFAWAGSLVGDGEARYKATGDLIYNTTPDDLALCVTPFAAEGEGEETGIQTADKDGNNIVSLSELLRVIQFYNSGGLHCADVPASTEDGFVPGAGANQGCTPYDTDYNPQDWIISLSELLRIIQFYNSGGYNYCPLSLTEDGFCPGL